MEHKSIVSVQTVVHTVPYGKVIVHLDEILKAKNIVNNDGW